MADTRVTTTSDSRVTTTGDERLTTLNTTFASGSGALTAQPAAVQAAVKRTVTGTGALAADRAEVVGLETSYKARVTTGGDVRTTTGGDFRITTIKASAGVEAPLAASSATLTVTASLTRNGSGAPQAALAAVQGAAERTATGVGALAAQRAALTGAGAIEGATTGAGSLDSQRATLAGSGDIYRFISTSGAFAAQRAALTGSGTATSTLTGSGTLAAQQTLFSAQVAATSTLTGSGTLLAGNASLEATGYPYKAAAGVLTAGTVTTTGAGEHTPAPRIAEGELQAHAAEIVAQILRTVHGSGTMSANAAIADVYPWIELHTQDNEWVEQKVDWGQDL